MTTLSTDTLIYRPVTFAEAPAVAELINTCYMADIGDTDTSAESLISEWSTAGFDPQTDLYTVWTPAGQVVAFAEAWTLGKPAIRNHVTVHVHPEYRQLGLEQQLLAWCTQRCQQNLAAVPEELLVVQECQIPAASEHMAQQLQAYGYALARHFWEMVIELDQPIPEPRLPEGLVIRPYDTASDLVLLIEAREEAFHDHWGHVEQPLETLVERWNHWRTEPAFAPDMWFVAMDGDEIAGFSICDAYRDYDPRMGWLGILGVRPRWRRQGLGEALLYHTFRDFQQRGQARVALGVDASSITGATRLYERAGMQVKHQFDTYEKVLRPGVDIRKR